MFAVASGIIVGELAGELIVAGGKKVYNYFTSPEKKADRLEKKVKNDHLIKKLQLDYLQNQVEKNFGDEPEIKTAITNKINTLRKENDELKDKTLAEIEETRAKFKKGK